MKNGSIKLSKTHGVNPTITVCFWCGEEKKEIALLGKLKNDEEAPIRMVLDYDPCDECRERSKLGIHMIEVTEDEPSDGRPYINKDKKIYPTGSNVFLKDEALMDSMVDVATIERVLETRAMFLDEASFEMLFGNIDI